MRDAGWPPVLTAWPSFAGDSQAAARERLIAEVLGHNEPDPRRRWRWRLSTPCGDFVAPRRRPPVGRARDSCAVPEPRDLRLEEDRAALARDAPGAREDRVGSGGGDGTLGGDQDLRERDRRT